MQFCFILINIELRENLISEVIKINTGSDSKKRWYDSDATVSLAVSILRNTEQEKQVYAAKKIIEVAKANDIEVKDVSIYVRTFRRRWYDEVEELGTAMECFKSAPEEIRKEMAVRVINCLCESEV